MKLFRATEHPPNPVDPQHFTGEATMAPMKDLSERPQVNMYRVTFQPGARTDWHTHNGGPQLLLVIEGSCRVQKAGEAIQEVAAGGAVRIESGERHWHGATPDGAMTHLAVNVAAITDWHEKVTDAEYAGDSSA
jgi:quercetin dioxygenase-like cupin family protein